MRNHEVTNEQLLLDDQGELREPGWSKSLVQQYRRSMIKAPKFRIKEWDYYLVTSDRFAAAFTISDDGYIGLQSVSLLVFGEKPWEHTETVLNAFPMGKLKLPEDSSTGETKYADKRLQMSFIPKDGTRHITCHFENFMDGKPLDADIVLEQPPMDTMVIATPWPKKHAFYYNQKINCMRASGAVSFDGETYQFNPATDFGTLDWGRGVWTYDNTWFWGSGNADVDGNAFGWNIGYGFGDTGAASENILFWNGTAHKLDDVTFNIPESGYMDTWTFTSSDGRFEMTFEPVLDRAACLDYKVIVSDQHQVFGRMSGKAVLDDGTEVNIKDVMCFAEKVHNKY
ncbi:MAG: DUF2804 domain-containing protein [Lachnospiraceae bacterium]|nr:DUF2804 domain-containing protein [Lachnospiraceae bacterium]